MQCSINIQLVFNHDSQNYILQIFNLNLLVSFYDYLPFTLLTSKQHL